ncbi:TetR/AcrR family transcriptional regulator [Umezawaea sp. NPDC059074]|uniref:TetR/AcrR family transcriptional regulator n=1 Tax=Umezawaea sp. NPDC059074 TaxID=3346716 RepID=UPI0036C01352
MTTPPLGLRDQKKLARREAMIQAAVRLAVERGVENALIEDITAAAGVSHRTFSNYFGGKAEAIAARHLDRARGVAEVLRGRPADEPLWDAITYAALSPYRADKKSPDPEWTASIRLMTSEPSLIGEFLKTNAIAERELADVIAERTGTKVTRDLYPRLVAATVWAAVEVATEKWLSTAKPAPITQLVRNALRQVAAGLPDPSAG